jgi:endonuclease/exonuclease/phosphatase family metal-dependent hydrolase
VIAKGVVAAGALALTAALAPAAAQAGDETARPDGRAVDVRVASYNIGAGAGMDGQFDVERQIDTLRKIDADVLSLQEVDVHWDARSEWRDLAAEIANGLGMRVFFGHIYELEPPAPGEPPREFGIAMLSRYPILSAENHEITRHSTQTGEIELLPGFPEIVVNVKGAHVHVYGTHLDFREDPAIREAQVADMLEIMAADAGRRQILLGDFNARPDAPGLAPLWRQVGDAWLLARERDDGFTYPADVPDRRIDYVTFSPDMRVRDARVPRTLASDHRPVVADLTITRGVNDAA